MRKELVFAGKTVERDNRLKHMKKVFENLKFEKASLLFHFIFMLKRKIVVLSLILLQNYALFQLHIYIFV